MRDLGAKTLLLAAIAAVFYACYLLQAGTGDWNGLLTRREMLLNTRDLPRALQHVDEYTSALAAGERPLFMPGGEKADLADLPSRAAALSLGGLRGFLAIYLWVDAETAKNSRNQEDLLDKYHRIATLQGDYTSVWEHHAWNQAWNMSVSRSNVEQRWEWVRYGLEFLREGIRRNPQSVDLLETMGRIYEQRIAENMRADDKEYFTAQVEKEEGEHPLRLAYLWYKEAREKQDETGEPHNLFSKKVLHQRSCFAAHEYAKNLTQAALEKLGEAAQLQESGQAEAAAKKLQESRQALARALAWWDQAIADWQRQLTQFPDDSNAGQFGGGAVEARREIRLLAEVLTPAYLKDNTHDFSVRVGSARGHRLLTARNIYDEEPPEKYQGPDFSLAPRGGNL